MRSFSAPEEMRARDVAGAVSDEKHGRDGHALGHTSVVGLHEGHVERHGRGAGGEQEVREELDTVWDAISLVDDGCASDAENYYADDEDAVELFVASAQPSGAGDDAGR